MAATPGASEAAAGESRRDSSLFDRERAFITPADDTSLRIAKGFVPNMKTTARIYVAGDLEKHAFDEFDKYCSMAERR